MTYDINTMPTNLTEWNTLIAHCTAEAQAKYDAELAAVETRAGAAFDANRDALREKMIAELEGNLAAETVETPDGPAPLPEAEYNQAWNEGVAEIDATLAQQRAKAIAQATSLIPQPETRADFEAMYSCYYPRPVGEQPAPTFEELKAGKKAELDAAFYAACRNATVETAGGWVADADETANRNVDGLIKGMEATGQESMSFCDHDNQFHDVSLEELKALQLQIIAKGQQLYATKWQYRAAIEAASSEAELDAIKIAF